MRINDFWDIVGGIFLLILVYLIISRGSVVNTLAKTLSKSTLQGIAVLQGRPINKFSI